MALTIDIDAGGDFAKQALATAKALEDIAKQEARIDAMAKKLGVDHKKIALAQQHLSDKAEKSEKQHLALEKKKSAGERDFRDKLKATAAGLYLIKNAAEAAYDVTLGLGKNLLGLAYHAGEAKREAGGMIDLFTRGKGGERFLAQLDGMAEKLGVSIEETRQKFAEFRLAGVDNRMAVQLIKLRADMIATGKSAALADHYISTVTAAGPNRAMAAIAFRRLTHEIRMTGDGAQAAAYNMTSVAGAEAKLGNVASKTLESVWEKIGPSVGKAANNLAEFVKQFLDSAEGKEMIDGITTAFKDLAGLVTKENVTEFLRTAKTLADGVTTSIRAVGSALGWVRSTTDKAAESVGTHGWFGAMLEADKNIAAGLVNGLTGGALDSAVVGAKKLASGVSEEFANVLGIHSPSKVFAEYGRNTVEGFQRGQESAAVSAQPLARAATPPSSAPSGGGGGGITIQNLHVHSDGSKPADVARSIRQELQLLLQAGALSRGGA